MSILPLREPLTDGTVTLRLPTAGDIDAVARYTEEGQLEDFWLPLISRASPETSVTDWLDAWAGRRSHSGLVLVVTIPESPDFIGVVGFAERAYETVEMIYGVAPRWRERGYASRAARIGGLWALTLPGVRTVELQIGRDADASHHVARNAGFRLAGTVSQFVPGTGETHEDLRFILDYSEPLQL